MAQLRKPKTPTTHQKLTNPGTSIFSDPAKLVVGDPSNPFELKAEEIEVLLLIRKDLLNKKNTRTIFSFPRKATMARLTRRPENQFIEIYQQLHKKGVLVIEDNNRQYRVGKNCAKAFAFIRDHFTDADKKRIEQYFDYSKEKLQDTLAMKKTSPYLKTEELEELVSIAGQLPNLTSLTEIRERTARLAEIKLPLV